MLVFGSVLTRVRALLLFAARGIWEEVELALPEP